MTHSIHDAAPGDVRHGGTAVAAGPGGAAGPALGWRPGPGRPLYVGQYGNNTIVSYDTTANPPTPTTFASYGAGPPHGLAFDAAGNLYVANNLSNTIEKFTPGGVGSVFASTGLSSPRRPGVRRGRQPLRGQHASNTIEKFTPGGVGSVFASTGLNRPPAWRSTRPATSTWPTTAATRSRSSRRAVSAASSPARG